VNSAGRECVALVSCAKKKREHASPAGDLYTSPLFQKMALFAKERCGRWYILSAKHGLLAPETIIAPYDVTLNQMSRVAQREWASMVHRQMVQSGLAASGRRLLWLAGRAYMRDLVPLLPNCEHVDPLAGLGLGKRLSWLNAQLAPRSAQPPGR